MLYCYNVIDVSIVSILPHDYRYLFVIIFHIFFNFSKTIIMLIIDISFMYLSLKCKM